MSTLNAWIHQFVLHVTFLGLCPTSTLASKHAPVNPLHGSINMDYETTFYPSDAKTKHSRINAILQIVSQSSSCHFMFKIRSVLLFVTIQHIHIHQTPLPFLMGRVSQSQKNWLIFIFLLEIHFISIQFNAHQLKRHLFYICFCLAPRTKGESRFLTSKSSKSNRWDNHKHK